MFNVEVIKKALADETLSLKALSTETKTPYSTLLKAIHAPVKGQAYDPEEINITAIEDALKAKMGEAFTTFDFEALITEASANAPLDVAIGAKLTIKRGGGLRDPLSIYTVVYANDEYVALESNTTKEPRVMAIKTLKLFGAQNVVEPTVETPVA